MHVIVSSFWLWQQRAASFAAFQQAATTRIGSPPSLLPAVSQGQQVMADCCRLMSSLAQPASATTATTDMPDVD